MNKAAIIVAVSMLLSRVLGIFREMLLAHAAGVSPDFCRSSSFRFSRATKSQVTRRQAGSSSATYSTRSDLHF